MMGYAAVKAKICGMRGVSVSGCARLLHYLPKRAERDFVAQMLGGGADLPYLLWKRLPALDKPTRESMRGILGMEIDLQNIMYVYRLKNFYDVHGDKVFGELIPVRYRLGEGDLQRLAHAAGMDSFAKVVADGFYGNIFSGLADLAHGEKKLVQAVRRQYKKHAVNCDFTAVCGFVYDKLQEGVR